VRLVGLRPRADDVDELVQVEMGVGHRARLATSDSLC
jgi:hypothetical protein